MFRSWVVRSFCVLLIFSTVNTFADDTMVATSGHRLEFADFETPSGMTDRWASRLAAPDGTTLLHHADSPLFGPALWFEWLDQPSWPLLLLRQYSGGMNCCDYYWLLDRDPPWRVVQLFDAGPAPIEVVDVDGDEMPEARTLDGTYTYWRTALAGSPMPELIWRVTPGGMKLARDLMRGRGPSPASRAGIAESLRDGWWELRDGHPDAWHGFGLDARLWGTTIEVLYSSGDLGEARSFFDKAWPEAVPHKEAFWRELLDLMACSPYGIVGRDCDATASSSH